MSETETQPFIRRAKLAREMMQGWQSTLNTGFKYGLASEDGFNNQTKGSIKNQNVFSSAAPDAVDEWAARMLYSLGIGFGSMVELVPGPAIAEADRDDPDLKATLAQSHETIFGSIIRSNFAVEALSPLKQSKVSTGALMIHEGNSNSVIGRCEGVPLYQISFTEGPDGTIQNVYREFADTLDQLRQKWPSGSWSQEAQQSFKDKPNVEIEVVDGTEIEPGKLGKPDEFHYRVVEKKTGHLVLSEKSTSSRWVVFRGDRDAGEVPGRGSVLRRLPDILTLNKLVELALKNAAIATTGIWQADDDGVLNPATIKLVPGAIIPKAVGSAGLTPLQAAGSFQISESMIRDYEVKIKSGIIGPTRPGPESGVRSATEWMIRDQDIVILNTPENARYFNELVMRVYRRFAALCQKKGLLGELGFDNGQIEIRPNSQYLNMWRRAEGAEIMQGLEMMAAAGAGYIDAIVDVPKNLRKVSKLMGLDTRSEEEMANRLKAMNNAAAAAQSKGAEDAA